MDIALSRRALQSTALSKPASAAQRETFASARKREFNRFLLSTLCDIPIDRIDENAQLKSIFTYGSFVDTCSTRSSSSSSIGIHCVDPFEMDVLRSHKKSSMDASSIAVRAEPTALLSSEPYLRLDAPFLSDDFYLNLMSWSKNNVLAIALGSIVYLYNAGTHTNQVLADVRDFKTDDNQVASVKWCTMQGQLHYLAVGTKYAVHIFDARSLQRVRMYDHTDDCRVAALSWNDKKGFLTAGFFNGSICNIDIRASSNNNRVASYKSHKAEICSLAWNAEGSCLASGSNDDTVCLWDAYISAKQRQTAPMSEHNPRHVLTAHSAAVKALAWCPHRSHMLATGGGSKDRTIKLWNAYNGSQLSSTETCSAVSSLLWGEKRIISGHGYDEPCVMEWNPMNMTCIQRVVSHKGRVLSLDMSPDGSSIASLGADMTLQLWKMKQPTQPTGRALGKPCSLNGMPSFGVPTIR
jgi:cell division cycle protein 20 (cofactor of APC complex)